MGLFDDGRTSIRVAVNEMQTKATNPFVPYGPEEVAESAVACAAAGASVVHFHSRTADGAQAVNDDSAGAGIYRRALELTAQASDILMEPTNLSRGHDPATAADTPQFWSLVDDPPVGTRLEVVNIDAFRFGQRGTGWREREQRLVPVRDWALDDDTPFAGPEVIRRSLECGLVPTFGLFDLGDARLLSAFARTGIVPGPVLVQINMFWDLMRGPTPGVDTLDAFLHEWRRYDIDSEVWVYARGAPDRDSYEELLSAALDRGVHLRVGLGDSAHLFPGSRNVDVVEHAAGIVAGRGLTPVTPAELRARIGVPAVSAPAAARR